MKQTTRREFLGRAAAAAPAIGAGWAQRSPNETINIAVVGFRSRGRAHYHAYAKIPNVRIAWLCDVDERLFPEGVAEVEQLTGYRPKTEYDFRKLIEHKDLDAVSIATPDHWHALQTVWACQAGKDVYVEKPVSYTIEEGRKMVQAARKYERIVQAGLNRRSRLPDRAAMQFLRSGEFGRVYRAKAFLYKGRGSIGRHKESSIPPGVHWDIYLGPAPYRPFTISRFHYGWHFFWDTSTSDIGNSGVHELDVARWGMKKDVHPVKVHSFGGYYQWDSDQETPNVQSASFEYEDGTILEVELTNLYTPPFDGIRGTGNVFYTDQGYLSSARGWHAVIGRFTPRSRPPRPSGVDESIPNASFPRREYLPGPEIPPVVEPEENHFENFIRCVRSRKREELAAEILEGHKSTVLAHLANISYRTGRKLTFDPQTEAFPGDEEANSYLTRKYREPYVMPEEV